MQNMPVVTGVRKLIVPSGDSSVRPFQEADATAHRPPEFSRSPRDFVPYPDEEVSIQMPPQPASPPTNSLVTILMPILGALVMVGFSVFAATQASNNQKIPVFAFLSLPMALFSVLGGVYNHYRVKKKYKEQVENRLVRYQDYLKNKRAELAQLMQAQRDASFSAHPDLRQCFDFAQTLAPTRLWERENGDPDFLDIRVGIGEMLSTFSIKVPNSSQFQLIADPLEEQARALPNTFGRVPGICVTLPLAQVGAAGYVGKRDTLINTMRASLLHLVAHHSPNEVKLVVLVPENEASEWDWVRWLPHNWSDGREMRFFGSSKATQSSVLSYLESVLKQRKNQQGSGNERNLSLPMPVYVIVWADIQLWRGSESVKFAPLVDMMLKEGKKLGAFSLFVSEHIARVPKSCEAMVDLTANPALLRFLGTKPQKFGFAPDNADRSAAWKYAQCLAPVRLTEAGGGAANLPTTTTLLELIGAARIEDVDVMGLWKQSEPHKNLSVPIGIGAGGKPLFLNLHEKGHGPHGLVAGTTGSGKTALLSTYLALASLYYHPHELGFIGIDFKGGDLIRDLKELPHMIGTMTNLESQGTDRAIKILRGEIKKRQGMFNRAGIGNIYDYQKMHRQGHADASAPMPHLVIVCDEFAELKKEQPDFIRELVSISRVGRSLGIHLILATQKPAGVVSDEIWSNSHFHLCLKVASLEDSREMLRRPEAAEITQQGRAYFQVGMNEVFELFQAAWGDAPYAPQSSNSSQPRIKQVFSDGSRVDLWPPKNKVVGTGSTQIQELVKHVCATARHNKIERVAGIWPPPLSESVGLMLTDILPANIGWDGSRWKNVSSRLMPAMGIKDSPEQQRQDLLRINLESDGHFVLFGAPGTGKTTALQSLITSIAYEHTPDQVHMYLLDFSGRALTVFENLPHVGAVINLGENERLRRLFSLLNDELDRRKKLVESDQTIVNYRKNHPGCQEADIVVVLDGFSHFVEAFKMQTIPVEVDNIVKLASQGGNLGVHLVITADQVKSFPAKLAGNVRAVATLEQNDINDYMAAIGRTGGLFPPKDAPGRGLVKDLPVKEFQSVQPAFSNVDLKQIIDEMAASWRGGRPRSVPLLPDLVSLCDLVPAGSGAASPVLPGLPVPLALNLAKPDLLPMEFALTDGPHFWISGMPQSGKTSLLQSWLLALAERYPPELLKFFLLDLGWGNFDVIKTLPHTLNCLNDASDIKTIRFQEALNDYLNIDFSGAKPAAVHDPSKPTVILAVDGFGAFTKGLTSDMSDKEKIADKNREYLLSIMRVKNARFHVMAAGYVAEFVGGAATNPVADVLRGFQTGFWLGDIAPETTNTFGFQLAMSEVKAGLSKGTTFYVNRGKYRVIKLATCHAGTLPLGEWLEQIAQQQSPTEAPAAAEEPSALAEERTPISFEI